jgi:hypothetical protein
MEPLHMTTFFRLAQAVPCLLAGLVWCVLPTATEAAACDYAIVVSETTLADPAWRMVVDSLVSKHQQREPRVLIHREQGLAGVAAELAACMPAFTCFVATPTEASREFIAEVHQLTRALDEDPYTDTLWGILTGFDAENALRIARREEPLVIEQVTSGTELAMDRVVEGAWFSELEQNLMVVKQRGEEARQAHADDDTTAAIAARLSDGSTDLFVTSGHATERDWQIGFRFRNGSFRSNGGALFGVDSAGHRFPIESSNAKVWLPIGNCLAGHIDGTDALALAFMNAAGVHQMLGYTVPTWFGYAGWGCLDYFVEQPGRYSLTEAFHANQHALIHEISRLEGEPQPPASLRGLRFDRDVVAFYGDPAWEARMAPGPLNYTQTLRSEQRADGRIEILLEIEPARGRDSFLPVNTNGSQRGGRPIVAFLPERLLARELHNGEHLHPVLTDRFCLIPNPGPDFDGQGFRLVFSGLPVVSESEKDAT